MPINPEKIDKLSDLYEGAKDCLIQLTIKEGEHHLQTAVFEHIREMRDIAAIALQNQKEENKNGKL